MNGPSLSRLMMRLPCRCGGGGDGGGKSVPGISFLGQRSGGFFGLYFPLDMCVFLVFFASHAENKLMYEDTCVMMNVLYLP